MRAEAFLRGRRIHGDERVLGARDQGEAGGAGDVHIMFEYTCPDEAVDAGAAVHRPPGGGGGALREAEDGEFDLLRSRSWKIRS